MQGGFGWRPWLGLGAKQLALLLVLLLSVSALLSLPMAQQR